MLRKLYLLDDDPAFGRLLAANLNGAMRIEVFDNARALFERRAEEPPDAVVTDLVMPQMDGIEVTRRLRETDPHLPIFVLTAHAEVESAVAALKAGATDYLTKPVNIDALQTHLRRAIEERPIRERAATLERVRKRKFSAGAILGAEPAIEQVRAFVERLADVPQATVLLLGESGTGKNLVARALHYSGPNTAARFVEINCSALPPHLLEAELFGYQRGAFTDARESKRGLMEVAHGGTLFLDEIAELPPELQAKLLNVLESRRFRRVGGTEEIEVSLRLVAATNRDLEGEVRAGRFRADLYYRVCVVTCMLPPLRAVRRDIPMLADHFRELFNREFKKDVRSIDPAALERLTAWQWPGNVRELRNVLERAMIFAEDAVLWADHLPPLGTLQPPESAPSPQVDGYTLPRGLTLAEAEREYIAHALATFGGDVQRAAESLGVSRKSLWERRKRHGLLK
ncbi:MAG: sigma-54 dependent transcriptional regulator [Gemmatimonadota bacterium]|nr:sigma-54 dependent transcriptional regulator [Gemmatimonadota bacterium]